MDRRDFLGLTLTAAMALISTGVAQAQNVDIKAVLHDPDAPETGNPDGDVTIVAFLDYNCPYCKKSAPDLARIVKDDGRVRLVFKDWPVLTDASVYGAQLALGAKYQGKYLDAHNALMAIPGHGVSADQMLAAVRATAIDMDRLQDDIKQHKSDIAALLGRTMGQADALGIVSTPTYLIGPFRTSTLDYQGFTAALAEARKRQAAGDRVE
ncbi:DsbA family protein [Martelella alba]|uniref:DsbA family protein n=1 Tax=Martelella alba TaxID=2590451 RepID=A0A506U2I4_9HYPH|nr:DsbA family protein [Martelella alba]TPW27205.1 DsbA family protein [Martelella alba]